MIVELVFLCAFVVGILMIFYGSLLFLAALTFSLGDGGKVSRGVSLFLTMLFVVIFGYGNFMFFP